MTRIRLTIVDCMILSSLVFGCNGKADVLTRGKLTLADLEGLDDKNIELAIVNDISAMLGEEQLSDLDRVRGLDDARQAVYVTWVVEGEVNNGGFNQFYYNSSGKLAPLAEKAFFQIGANRFGALVTKANRIYSGIKPRLDAMNDGSIESFSKSYENNPLNDCDKEFYDLYKDEDISKLRIKFIRNQLTNFSQ